MTEYAYSRKEPCISSTTSMSRMRSSKSALSSGCGVFVLRRAIAAAAPSQSLPGHERVLTRTIVDRATDNADHDPSVEGLCGPIRGAFAVSEPGSGRTGAVRVRSSPRTRSVRRFSLSAYEVRELRQLSARLHTVAGPTG